MSASRLRAAAELLRTRAEAATDGPWSRDWTYNHDGSVSSQNVVASMWDVATCYGGYVAPEDGRQERARQDADYIAMMSPPVALALADWLDQFANLHLRWTDRPGAGPVDPNLGCIALADAILGAPTTDTTTNEGRDE